MSDINERHRVRMERKKAHIDAKIAAADKDIGIIIVNTGNGKGKSSSGFGMVVRAMGHGMKVAVVQFIKGAMSTGEEKFLRRFPEEVSFHAMGEGFTWETQDRARDILKAQEAWAKALEYIQNPDYKLVLLDEVNVALKLEYLSAEAVLAGVGQKPEDSHVILTGRGAPADLIEAADLVTEMTMVKHPFREQGIKAQAGIEF